ncbi:HAD-IC family P-type ATPase, partial [Patescibacteria group bacterium]|nr:HAD-IC family P-type ATPase [Patescibacteria group bacterium]
MRKETDVISGLSSKQAEELLASYGPNEIKEVRKFTLLSSFFAQFNNFLTILLILAAFVSFLLGERIDSFFISLIVILNALFGLYNEAKAEKALETLKQLTISIVRVIRDGKQQEIDSRSLVPGDIVYLEEGNKIPADGEVLDSMHLEVNEASLTGESLPVEKKAGEAEKNSLFMGTIVARGRGYIKVLATGASTRFGKIAKTLSSIEKVKTPLQKKLEVFTKQIGIIGILASASVFILSFVKDKSLLESFIFAVSLAVAAVPEGLPAVMTITLAIGVEKMAKRKAIIRKLNSIEALGSVTLVATDKTGTLTTNKMRVKKIWVDEKVYNSHNPPTLSNHPFSRMILNASLCSTASIVFKIDHGDFDVIGDPTEGSVLLLAQKAGLVPDMVRN